MHSTWDLEVEELRVRDDHDGFSPVSRQQESEAAVDSDSPTLQKGNKLGKNRRDQSLRRGDAVGDLESRAAASVAPRGCVSWFQLIMQQQLVPTRWQMKTDCVGGESRHSASSSLQSSLQSTDVKWPFSGSGLLQPEPQGRGIENLPLGTTRYVISCKPTQPQLLDVGMELESAHMGAHLAAWHVTGESMKAKPNESARSQNLPANICPALQLQPAPASRSPASLYSSLELQFEMCPVTVGAKNSSALIEEMREERLPSAF
ncbi:unnamed protein product [Pleuronectes platessa]|uniref:Uncharacterized protein n=1 Tax=Pleuronectes platessa TaxID=8262 RepID=A0A9N7VB11_PLEPL|nr:unnamed protein product [Pleuronectes platessa]